VFSWRRTNELSRANKFKPGEKGKSLRDEIRDREKAYVLFYATWCPFSQRFLPLFEECERNNPQECLKVIVDDAPEVCEEYAIEYYPTVILFENGKVKRRLEAQPHIGLNEKQLKDFTENQ
jgi:thiol-disulfide isomerase/thioredoxin